MHFVPILAMIFMAAIIALFASSDKVPTGIQVVSQKLADAYKMKDVATHIKPPLLIALFLTAALTNSTKATWGPLFAALFVSTFATLATGLALTTTSFVAMALTYMITHTLVAATPTTLRQRVILPTTATYAQSIYYEVPSSGLKHIVATLRQRVIKPLLATYAQVLQAVKESSKGMAQQAAATG